MKFEAKVTILNTANEPYYKDPKKVYPKVLVMQGVDTRKLSCNKPEVFEKCQEYVGCNVVIVVEHEERFGRMDLVDMVADLS